MEKNKNRSDLLAAGRKKVIFFCFGCSSLPVSSSSIVW